MVGSFAIESRCIACQSHDETKKIAKQLKIVASRITLSDLPDDMSQGIGLLVNHRLHELLSLGCIQQ